MKPEMSYIIIRPRWDEICYHGGGVLMCTGCLESLFSVSQAREHWQLGHFDRVINPGDEDYARLTGGVTGDGP